MLPYLDCGLYRPCVCRCLALAADFKKIIKRKTAEAAKGGFGL